MSRSSTNPGASAGPVTSSATTRASSSGRPRRTASRVHGSGSVARSGLGRRGGRRRSIHPAALRPWRSGWRGVPARSGAVSGWRGGTGTVRPPRPGGPSAPGAAGGTGLGGPARRQRAGLRVHGRWPRGCWRPPPTASSPRCWRAARRHGAGDRPADGGRAAPGRPARAGRPAGPGPAARRGAGRRSGRRSWSGLLRRRARWSRLLHLARPRRRLLAGRAAARRTPSSAATRACSRAPAATGRLAAVNGDLRRGQAGRRHRGAAPRRHADGRARRDGRRRRRSAPGRLARLRAARLVARHARAASWPPLRASGPLLGFVLLLNLDVLLARHHLTAAQAGEYAVAAIFAKVAFWLPQGVGVVLLPRLADAGHRRGCCPRRWRSSRSSARC